METGAVGARVRRVPVAVRFLRWRRPTGHGWGGERNSVHRAGARHAKHNRQSCRTVQNPICSSFVFMAWNGISTRTQDPASPRSPRLTLTPSPSTKLPASRCVVPMNSSRPRRLPRASHGSGSNHAVPRTPGPAPTSSPCDHSQGFGSGSDLKPSDDIKAQARAVPRLQGGTCLACLLYFLCACCKSNQLKAHGTALIHVHANICQPITIKSQISQSLLPPSLPSPHPTHTATHLSALPCPPHS